MKFQFSDEVRKYHTSYEKASKDKPDYHYKYFVKLKFSEVLKIDTSIMSVQFMPFFRQRFCQSLSLYLRKGDNEQVPT